MFCKHCGEELTDDCGFCQHCGESSKSSKGKNDYNILSIMGLIVAGISLLLNFWGIVGIAAVVLSSMGLLQINKTGEKGKGIAIAGISIGSFSIIYGLLMILLLIV